MHFHLHEVPDITVPLETSNTSSQDFPKGSWWQGEVQVPCATSKHVRTHLQVPEPRPNSVSAHNPSRDNCFCPTTLTLKNNFRNYPEGKKSQLLYLSRLEKN